MTLFDNGLKNILKVSLLALIASTNVYAADDSLNANSQKLWKSMESKHAVLKQIKSRGSTTNLKTRLIELDETVFESALNDAVNTGDHSLSERNSAKGKTKLNSKTKIIQLPLPNGTEVSVEITPTSVLSPSLAKQYPKIKTWNVKGLDQNITGTVDFTHKGFHGMLVMPDGDKVFIEPDVTSDGSNDSASSQRRYMSFSKRGNRGSFNKDFSCGVHDRDFGFSTAARSLFSARPAANLITYRLAVATTGEYSQFHGGTVASTLSAITTTINRVNEVFRRDFGVQFELIAEQADIIYLDKDTDPYTNDDVTQLVFENDFNLSSAGVLGRDKYDVGHVFGEGNVGGLALVGGVCTDEDKAFGATGISSPVGDVFDLDFVAHELGHQLGGSHTFNSACSGGSERIASTAVEPGSGTTIMSYAGICQSNDIQNSVDPQFHIVSIDQIRDLTRLGAGSSCGVETVIGNENPTVDAGDDSVVPARTPLVFIADGADDDNDDLTYSWEQSDAGTLSDVNVDTGDNALFRSRPLTSNNVRFIPRIEDLYAGTVSSGEVLPVTNRDINMVATVRDGRGGLEADQVKLEVFDTGDSFRVTSHNSDLSFSLTDTTELTWNVAGTDVSPISCSSVDIGLITENGDGLDLLATSNDGREVITIPSDAPAMQDARFIISCTDSNFFNISSGEVTVLDEIGGRFVDGGGESPVAVTETEVETDTDTGGSSGGGTFNLFTLMLSLIVVVFRKLKPSLKNTLKTNKQNRKLAVLVLPLCLLIQACAADSSSDKELVSSSKVTPKEFSGRFSIDKIKAEREAFYTEKLSELRKKSAVAEVSKALKSNDIYYMALPVNRGASITIPGLMEPESKIENCKTVVVEGMGDSLYGKNHVLYRKELLNYMHEFNALMSPHCK